MATTVEICIDVPDLGKARAFYVAAFGLSDEASPVPDVVVLATDNLRICLLEKEEGSRPSPSSGDIRRYRRHWTPVHLDFRTSDIHASLERVLAAGAVAESDVLENKHGSWVTCADPFGNGFCLIQPNG
ncbi:MAG: VOC family protein [Lysobacterales bacterium]|jgi:predicted enzyme related to lactoylglutathione lyase